MADVPEFEIAMQTDGRVRVVRLAGNLDRNSAPIMRAAFANHVVQEPAVVVDMSGVALVDTAGLGALVFAYRSSVAEGWTVTLRRPAPDVAAMLRTTGVDNLLAIEA
jgi:anti-anti-sigma factor